MIAGKGVFGGSCALTLTKLQNFRHKMDFKTNRKNNLDSFVCVCEGGW